MDIGVKAYNAGSQSISTGATDALNANSEEWDTHSFHDNTTNNSQLAFTGGGAGKYIVGFSFKANVTFTSDETPFTVIGRVRRNGSTDECGTQGCGYLWRFSVTVGSGSTLVEQNTVCIGRTDILDMASTDTLEVTVTNNSTSHSITVYDFRFYAQKVNVAGRL